MFVPSLCGCFHFTTVYDTNIAQFLPQVDLKVHSTILASTSRTTLTQTFINPSSDVLKDVRYTLPLYEGVSVVAFKCEVGDRVIHGLVKPREAAKAEYDQAVEQGKAAALLEQARYTSEVFTTSIGNVPQASKVVVAITYLGTLQHDAEADGLRFTIPVSIAPRYAGWDSVTQLQLPSELDENLAPVVKNGRISITADVAVDKESTIRQIQSPSHPISVSLGRLSTSKEDDFKNNCASATLAMKAGHVLFNNDFVLIVQATEQDVPVAYLETHPSIPNHRAIMATLVPKFNIPSVSPEIVFLIDQSGSMLGKMHSLKSALSVFLKSLPVGTVFNICSFGSSHSFLWEKSRLYDDSSSKEALEFVQTIDANMGGTEIYEPARAAVFNRFKDLQLEVLLLTDGQVSNQKSLFKYIEEVVAHDPIRFFSLGIGETASHSLVNGVARAGRGFAQSVGTHEKLEKKVVRMLKGALSPQINDYRAEIEFGPDDVDEEYDMVENAEDIPTATDPPPPYQITHSKTDTDSKKDIDPKKDESGSKPPIPLYDPSFKESEIGKAKAEKEPDLMNLPVPKVLQVPHKLPPLYTFNRTNVYFLLSPDSCQKTPRYIVINATSRHGPLTLRVPIEHIGRGSSIHQLAARALSHELEEGRGWIFHAKDKEGEVIVERHQSKKERLVKREAIRLGVQFQVSGEHSSFIAVERDKQPGGSERAGATENEYPFSPQTEGSPLIERNYLDSLGDATFLRRVTSGVYDPTIEDVPLPGQPLKMAAVEPADDGQMFLESPSVFYHKSAKKKHMRLTGFDVFGAMDSKFTEASAKFRRAARKTFKGKKKTGASSSGEGTSVSTKAATGSKEEVPNSKGATSSKNVPAAIALQTFEGSWKWDNGLFGTVTFSEEDLEKNLDWSSILGIEGKVDDPGQRTVIATLATVAYLQKKYPGDAETWELVVDKAMGWVRTKLDEMGGNSARDNKELLALFDGLFEA